VVVEIGSWQGKSTIYLGHAIASRPSKVKIYAVDPHTGSEERQLGQRRQAGQEKVWTFAAFEKNIKEAGLTDLVTPVVKESVAFARTMQEPVELIFIDGAHDYKSVEQDFQAWFPKVIDGGVMAFHDTYVGGDPYKVLRKYVYPSRRFGVIRSADSITYVQKLSRNSLPIYLRNRVRMLYGDAKAVAFRSAVVRAGVRRIKALRKSFA
jgi:predicted O-methyltransferase YrrM